MSVNHVEPQHYGLRAMTVKESPILLMAMMQMRSVNDLKSNCNQVKQLVEEARSQDASVNIFCFPENSLYVRLGKGDLFPRLAVETAEIQDLHLWAVQKRALLILGSVSWAEKDQMLSNATLLLGSENGPKVIYRKMHLFDVEVDGAPPVRESEVFIYGPQPVVIEYKGWKIGLTICYDLRFSELFKIYADYQCDLVLVPAAFLVPTGKAHWHTLLKARAIESQCYILAAAQAGEHQSVNSDDVRHTFGHSLFVDPWGQILNDLGSSEISARTVRLEASLIEKVRAQIPMSAHRRIGKQISNLAPQIIAM